MRTRSYDTGGQILKSGIVAITGEAADTAIAAVPAITGTGSNAGADILVFLCCSSAAAYHANADSAAGYRFEFLAVELGFVRHFGGKIFRGQLVPALFGKLQYLFIGFQ